MIDEVTRESIEVKTAGATDEEPQIPCVVDMTHQERLALLAESHNKNRQLSTCFSARSPYSSSDYGTLFELRQEKGPLQRFLFYSEDKQVRSFLS